MNQSEAVALLERFQAQFDINKVTYNNKNVWPILRYYFGRVLMTESAEVNNYHSSGIQANQQPVSNRTKLKFAVSVIRKVLQFSNEKIVFKKKASNVIFVSPFSEPYPDEVAGKKYSRYLDPYIEFFQKNIAVMKLQLTKADRTREMLFIPATNINEDNYIAWRRTVNKLTSSFRRKKQDQFYKVLDDLNVFAKTNGIVFYFDHWLVNHLDEVEEYELLFMKLLASSKVKVVFFECYYSSCLFGLISACRKLNIRTVDIQHGNVDINYLGWNNIAKEVSHFLPNQYWTWSVADQELVAAGNSANGIQPVLGGNMWFKRSLSITNNFVLNTSSANYSKKVLVSLQYSFFLSYTIQLVAEAIRISGQEFLWMIRFHPLNTESEKAEAISTMQQFTNVEYKNTSAANLYSVLKYANVHVVASSAVAKEGLQFGLSTIIIHEQGCDLFRELIESNVFGIALNPHELLERINNFKPSAVSSKFRMETSEMKAFAALEQIVSKAA